MADPTSIVYLLERKKREDMLMHLPFDGDAVSTTGQGGAETGPPDYPTATQYPAEVRRPKVGTGGMFAAIGSTNLVSNPSFETGYTGWSQGVGQSMTRVTDVVAFGSYALKVTRASAANTNLGGYSVTLTAVEHWVSIWVYLPSSLSGATYVRLYLEGWTGSASNNTYVDADLTITDAWQRLYITLTPDAGDLTGSFVIRADCDTNDFLYLDAAQVETQPSGWIGEGPTPYLDGSLGDAYSWSGTAHASTSTRTAQEIVYDEYASATVADQMSVIFGYQFAVDGSNNGMAVEWKGADSNNRIIIQQWGTLATWSVYINGAWRLSDAVGGGPGEGYLGPDSASPGDWHYVMVTFDFTNDEYDVHIYDQNGAYSHKQDTTALTIPTVTEMTVGGRTATGGPYANGLIDDFVVVDTIITKAEFDIMYADFVNGVRWNGAWNDISADIVGEVNFSYGIESSLPQDRQAGAGNLSFKLNNSTTNSAGLVGYYSPDHANARTGFDLGSRVKVKIEDSADATVYHKWTGFLDSISPAWGANRERLTTVSASDWLDDAARLPINARVPIQANVTGDQVFTKLLTAIDRQPESTDFDVGQDTFTYALDTGESNKTTILREFQKVVSSELGYGYIKGDALTGGVLTFENRHARVIKIDTQFTLSEGMISMKTARTRERIKNLIRVTTHPRDVDAAATSILTDLDSTPEIRGGATLKLIEDYRDPSNASRKAGGTDVVVPVPGTDYTMNSAEGGGGTDFTYDQKGKALSTAATDIKAYFPLDDDPLDYKAANHGIIDPNYAEDGSFFTNGFPQMGQTGIGDGRTSCYFDGASGINVLTPTLVNFDGELATLNIWAKIGASEWTDGTDRELIRIEDDGIDNVILIRKSTTTNQILFYYEANGTADQVTDTSLAGDTGWHMYSITIDTSNDRMRAYIDGAQVGSDQGTLGDWSAGDVVMADASIGCANYSSTPSTFFKGYLAHAGFWNHELTAAELLAIYNTQTGGFNVDWVVGGFAVEWNLTNQESSPGYVTKLQLKGKLVRDFEPVTQEAKNDASILNHGELLLTQDMPLQENPLVGKDAAEYLLTNLQNPTTDIEGVEFHANKNATYLTAALLREPGDRITLTESVTGISAVDFFINGVSFRIIKPNQIFCTWHLVPADDVAFWAIGEAGYSEIGETTYVSY